MHEERKESELIGSEFEDIIQAVRDAVHSVVQADTFGDKIGKFLHEKDSAAEKGFRIAMKKLREADNFFATLL